MKLLVIILTAYAVLDLGFFVAGIIVLRRSGMLPPGLLKAAWHYAKFRYGDAELVPLKQEACAYEDDVEDDDDDLIYDDDDLVTCDCEQCRFQDTDRVG